MTEKIKIGSKEYEVKELTLAQKIKIAQPIVSFIKDALKDVTIKKTPEGGIDFNLPEGGIKVADLNVEQIIFSLLEFMPEILAMSIPEFKEWDTLGETELREPLEKVMEVNDFGGFVINFISFMGAPFRYTKR